MVTAQSAQRDGVSLLLSLTRDPARIEARLRQAALLEAAQVPDRAVDVIIKTSTTGRLTHENILVLRDTGIDIDALRDAPVPARAPWSVYRCDDDTGCDCGKWIAASRMAAVEFDTESAARAYVARQPRKRYTPSDHHWKIRRVKGRNYWFVESPDCPGWCTPITCTCTTRPNWQAAIDHVTQQLRDRALAAIENQEATSQPQEDQ